MKVGTGSVRSLDYSSDSRTIVVDARDPERDGRWIGDTIRQARELVWWDFVSGEPVRRHQLGNALYGPGGNFFDEETEGRPPNLAALDVSFRLEPLRVVTLWDWTNKEDGVAVYDVEEAKGDLFFSGWKTHYDRFVLSPDGSRLLLVEHDVGGGFSWFSVKPLSLPGSTGIAMPTDDRGKANGCPNYLRGITDLDFDGRHVAALEYEQPIVWVWDSYSDPPTEDELDDPHWEGPIPQGRRLPLGSIGTRVRFGSTESRLAVGGTELLLMDTDGSNRVSLPRERSPISALAFGPDDRDLLAGTESGSVEWWDVTSGRLVRVFEWNCGAVRSLAVAPDKSTFGLGTQTGELLVWDRDAGANSGHS